MPVDTETFPQLPPIPPQTPFNNGNYPWERHYPSSSWETPPTPARGSSLTRTRSKSTSPGTRYRPLPSPPPPLPTDAALSYQPEGLSPPPRSHSHTRSASRVVVQPSTPSAEPIMLSPPARTHSRSVSSAAEKKPARPSTADPATRVPHRTKSRPLPLPLPPKDYLHDAIPEQFLPPVNRILARTESLPIPKPPPVSAPVRTQSARPETSPETRRAKEATLPSAPLRRLGSPPRPRAHTMFVTVETDQSFLSLDAAPHLAGCVPVRAPTPPKPRLKAGLPATPRRQDNRGSDREHERERGRSTHVATPPVAATAPRASPGSGPAPGSASATRTKQPPPPSSSSTGGFARKWVLEKKGKRLTQDSTVVAQQLRLLR
ncbi:hypothetical protein BD413DRAFT_614235 [Trametes elegans]|nr:hypothetical protein BD413DRAFT_614235 [Trametes elegans]